MLLQESEEGSEEEQGGGGGGVVSFVAKNYDPTLQMKKKKRKDTDRPEGPTPKKWKGTNYPFLFTTTIITTTGTALHFVESHTFVMSVF